MPTKTKYDKRIYRIFLSDQKDRSSTKVRNYNTKQDWQKLKKRDGSRQEKLFKIIKSKNNLSGQDYFMMAIVFQHGTKISDSKKAINFAQKGIELKNEDSKWIFAAATDRLLMRQNKKQKFGTQYTKTKTKWKVYSIDPKTTDKERAEYNVIPLKEIKAKAEEWNKAKSDPWNIKRKQSGITSTK